MGMPTVAEQRGGRPPKANKLAEQLSVSMDRRLRTALQKWCQKELQTSEGGAVRKIIIERLRQDGFLSD